MDGTLSFGLSCQINDKDGGSSQCEPDWHQLCEAVLPADAPEPQSAAPLLPGGLFAGARWQ